MQRLVGFNVMRREVGHRQRVKINPVWIPAVGDISPTPFYQYLDAGADPSRAYEYTIEGVTEDGLSSLSDSAPLPARTRWLSATLNVIGLRLCVRETDFVDGGEIVPVKAQVTTRPVADCRVEIVC